MTYIVPVAEIEVDYPDCDGLITEHGGAFDWEFRDVPDSTEGTVWDHSNTELLRGMNAVAPRAYVKWQNMDLSLWDVDAGGAYWQTARPAGCKPRVDFLQFANSAVGSGGQVTSKGWFWPSTYMRLFRFAPVDGETGTPSVEVQFLGNGIGLEYGIELPWPTLAEGDYSKRYPRIYTREPGGATATCISEFTPAGGMGLTSGTTAGYIDLQVEQIGDWLRVLIDGVDEPWLVKTGPSQPLTKGPARVIFNKQAGMFNLNNLRSPITSSCAAQEYLAIPAWMAFEDSSYATNVYERPVGCGIAVAEDVAPTNARASRPVLTFTSTGYTRPVLWLLTQFETGTIGNTRSSSTTTSGTQRFLSATWRRDNSYRDAEFTAVIREPDEYSWGGYEKATLKLAWDSGEAVTTAARVTGYVEPHKGQEAPALPDDRQLEIVAKDGVSMILSKKFMVYMPCFEGRTVEAAFAYILQRCGVPTTNISIDADVDAADYTLPVSDPPWERTWRYAPDYSVISALDEMTAAFGLQWGVDANGTYFLRYKPVWTTGDTPDYVLDQSNTDADEFVENIDPERSPADFRNYVAVMAGTDTRAGGIIARDEASHRTTTDDKFVGNDLWEVVIADNPQQALYQAQQVFAEAGKWRDVIAWTTRNVSLGPDSFVEVRVEGIDIPSGSIFRIVSEDGTVSAGEDNPDMQVTYTMVVEEYGV